MRTSRRMHHISKQPKANQILDRERDRVGIQITQASMVDPQRNIKKSGTVRQLKIAVHTLSRRKMHQAIHPVDPFTPGSEAVLESHLPSPRCKSNETKDPRRLPHRENAELACPSTGPFQRAKQAKPTTSRTFERPVIKTYVVGIGGDRCDENQVRNREENDEIGLQGIGTPTQRGGGLRCSKPYSPS